MIGLDNSWDEALDHLSFYGDFYSFLLLAVTTFLLPFVPCERVWPRVSEKWLWRVLIAANLIWNFSRFFVEGESENGVPRGFMEISLVYSSLWAYALLGRGLGSDALEYKRTKEVVRLVAGVKMVRVGRYEKKNESEEEISTTEDNTELCGSAKERKYNWEIVVRSGCERSSLPFCRDILVTQEPEHKPCSDQAVGDREYGDDGYLEAETWTFKRAPVLFPGINIHGRADDKTRRYWRGIETEVQRHSVKGEPNTDPVWKVMLVEEELHEAKLSSLLRVERLWQAERENPKVKLYKAVYDTVYSSCRTLPDHEYLQSEGEGDGKWPNEEGWSALGPEDLATQAGCEDSTRLGGIARRIASDAVKFVFSSDKNARCWTGEHIDMLNGIVKKIATSVVKEKLKEVEEQNRTGVPSQSRNNDDDSNPNVVTEEHVAQLTAEVEKIVDSVVDAKLAEKEAIAENFGDAGLLVSDDLKTPE